MEHVGNSTSASSACEDRNHSTRSHGDSGIENHSPEAPEVCGRLDKPIWTLNPKSIKWVFMGWSSVARLQAPYLFRNCWTFASVDDLLGFKQLHDVFSCQRSVGRDCASTSRILATAAKVVTVSSKGMAATNMRVTKR